jgi:hypothetical protein
MDVRPLRTRVTAMERSSAPFPAAWFTSGPNVLWGLETTYGLIPYDLLPPIEHHDFDGTFSWLPTLPPHNSRLDYDPDSNGCGLDSLPEFEAEARSLGLSLPKAFVHFVSTADLYQRVPSCTACYLDFSHGLIEDPSESGGRMLRFMNDSQACVLWYLYLAPSGDHCVLASGEWHYGFRDDPNRVLDPKVYFWCAPNFESFVYRFWLEDQIWRRVRHGEVPTPEEARYLQAAIGARARLPALRG